MLQHRHDQPILGTREFTPGTRKVKQAALTLSFNEYGEPLTPEDVDANLAQYRNPPEYNELGDPLNSAAVREAEKLLDEVARK